MFTKVKLLLLSSLLLLVTPRAGLAETVMEKVARTGILTVGISLNQAPYSYINAENEIDGYSVNVVNLIRNQLSQELGKPITLQAVQAEDAAAQISKLQNREVDIVCNTAFTWNRDQYVDFSTSYNIVNVRVLVPQGSNLLTLQALAGKRLAVVPNTVFEKAAKLAQPQATLVPIATFTDALKALKAKKVDGVVGDSLFIMALSQSLGMTNLDLAPQSPLASYGVGCMLPQGDATFRRQVNYTIVKFMGEFLRGDPQATELINTWIGEAGLVQVDPEVLRNFFRFTVMTHEQIP
ncbi:extracellular substrate binding-like orphan protein GrrP [Synechococcus sp. PCC 6312]|uniref:extracellular substrate binding-like orphan protein GrrP n=1 Tax=Synechococcus sp. (strain ATCC 27167 / PCC 6312) TaxID=195253 RepID=UPI00029EE1DE|nr:extracellular substrate binding-like orphan protein GrrP [Synechococcus sp. PCC 6312]AFY60593.1 amino acid ABC transporter substrate-binding protein, PAAT family [Synechococcus sp. PCC 6312]